MSGLNDCNFIGNVGGEPQIKVAGANNTKIANFSLAVTTGYGDKKKTEWINFTALGKVGDVVEKFVHKGSKIHVQATFTNGEYEKDGEKKKNPKFLVTKIVMLGGQQQTQGSSGSYSNKGSFQDLGDW